MTNIHQIAYILITTVSSEAVTFNRLPWCYKGLMIIETPPNVLFPIKHITVVMAVLCKSIMNQDSVKKVWSLPFFGKWMSNQFLKVFYSCFYLLSFLVRGSLKCFHNLHCSLNLILRKHLCVPVYFQILRLEIVELLILDLDAAGHRIDRASWLKNINTLLEPICNIFVACVRIVDIFELL